MFFEANLMAKTGILYPSLYLIIAKACISAGKIIVRGVTGGLRAFLLAICLTLKNS